MTTKERQDVRQHLIDAGFERSRIANDNPKYYDLNGTGAYTELWVHTQDETIITLDWDRKTK